MSGLNRFYLSRKFNTRKEFLKGGVKCVFISYQNNDKKEAKKIADFLISAGINVYFDEYDVDLKRENQSKNPSKVTDALRKGINNSSHMLVVVSPTTIISQWVPFEIGYGYDKTNLFVLCLKGIPKGGLPEYVRSAKIIRDYWDLKYHLSSLVDKRNEFILEARIFVDEYPLTNIMDNLINDKY